jgi:uncharacterized membrane protein
MSNFAFNAMVFGSIWIGIGLFILIIGTVEDWYKGTDLMVSELMVSAIVAFVGGPIIIIAVVIIYVYKNKDKFNIGKVVILKGRKSAKVEKVLRGP